MLIGLKEGILYGPVNSRRLGKSLGVNLMPWRYKLCSFNCVYCHFGWTDEHLAQIEGSSYDIPKFDDVIIAIEKALGSDLVFDYITFSGNGEPTLYPDFYGLVEETKRLRDRLRPKSKIGLLSNSSNISSANVQQSIMMIDLPMFKLDAGLENTFNRINYPVKGICFREIIGNLKRVGDRIIVQTTLIDGEPSNTGSEDLKAYYEHIREIKPKEVHIYSIDRPVPEKKLMKVTPERLDKIAIEGYKRTGILFRAFYIK